MENGFDSKRRRASVYIVVLAVIGLLLSGELLRIHITVGNSTGHNFACSINEAMDCSAVAQSRQSKFLEVPVPAWGILTYLVFLVLGIVGILSKQPPGKHAGDYALGVSVWCVAYSGYLAYVSAFELKTFCLYCAGLYGVNAGLFFASIPASAPLLLWWRRRVFDRQWLMADLVRFGVVSIIFVIMLGSYSGYYYWSTNNDEDIVPVAPGVRINIENDPVLGHYRTPLTIIEFSDFECPACRQMHEVTKELLQKYKGSIRLVHKNFPLDSKCNSEVMHRMHLHSCEAAAAAECAFREGKFETYAELLWEADDLSTPSLIRMAEDEGMDAAVFQECLTSEETRLALQEDVAAGIKLGIEGTPTFVINGKKFMGIRDLKWCSQLIERFLAEKSPKKSEPVQSP